MVLVATCVNMCQPYFGMMVLNDLNVFGWLKNKPLWFETTAVCRCNGSSLHSPLWGVIMDHHYGVSAPFQTSTVTQTTFCDYNWLIEIFHGKLVLILPNPGIPGMTTTGFYLVHIQGLSTSTVHTSVDCG